MNAIQGCMFALGVVTHGVVSPADGLMLLYLGPDQFLPLTSALGAIAGILLMFWNRVVGLLRAVTRSGRPPEVDADREEGGDEANVTGESRTQA